MSTTTVSTGLTGPQLQALEALLAGRSTAEAARVGSVSQQTVRDWLQQPEFRAAFMQGQHERFHQISMQLAGAASRALLTLIAISEDPEQKGSVRVSAANKVMHLFLHHGPRVSALLEPPKVEQEPAAPDPRSVVYENLMAALDRVYGSEDEEESLAPAAASLPSAAAAPASPLPASPAPAGCPAPSPDPDPRDIPPAPGLPPSASASQHPARLTLAGRSAAETASSFIEPGSEFVSWRR